MPDHPQYLAMPRVGDTIIMGGGIIKGTAKVVRVTDHEGLHFTVLWKGSRQRIMVKTMYRALADGRWKLERGSHEG